MKLVIAVLGLVLSAVTAFADQPAPYPQPVCREYTKCIKRASECVRGEAYIRILKEVKCVAYDGKLTAFDTEGLRELDYTNYRDEAMNPLCNEERTRVLETWDMCKN